MTLKVVQIIGDTGEGGGGGWVQFDIIFSCPNQVITSKKQFSFIYNIILSSMLLDKVIIQTNVLKIG